MPTPRRFPGAIPASSISSRTLAATPSKNASGERESSDRQRRRATICPAPSNTPYAVLVPPTSTPITYCSMRPLLPAVK